MKIEDTITKVAEHVADRAIDGDTPFSESLDALGKLTAFYGLVLKHHGFKEDPDVPTMGSLQQLVKDAGPGDD